MPSSSFAKAWSLLSSRERRMGVALLCLVVLSSLLAVAMVGAIYPFFAVVSNPVGILENPRFAGLFASLGVDTPERLIVVAGAGTLLAIVVANLVALVKAYAMARYFAMRSFALSARMFQLQARQPYEDFLNTHPSEFMKRTVAEPTEVVQSFMEPLGNMIAALVSIVMMLALLVFLNVWVTMVVFGLFTTSYIGIMVGTKGPLRRKGAVRMASNTGRVKVLHELAHSARDIRMTGQEAAFVHRFSDHSEKMFQSQIAVNFWSQIPRYGMQMLFFGGVVIAGMVVVLVSTDPGAAQETLTNALPLTGVFVMAAQRLIPELQSVYASFGKIAYGTSSVEALWKDMQRMEAQALPIDRAQPMRFESLVMRDVQIAYAGQTEAALRGVNFALHKGDKVALIGPSGSGKSTLIQVLMGLLQPQEGVVEVNGKPLDIHHAAAWRASVAQVPQEVVVLSDTLLRNVAFGFADEDIDANRVRKALEDVQLDAWVAGLDNGLDTDLQSGVAPLSGGQKQRLGIARALYRNADVVILDEATSALDAQTQQTVVDLMNRVFADKTVVAIAHRPEAIAGLPRRVFMEKGLVVRDETIIQGEGSDHA